MLRSYVRVVGDIRDRRVASTVGAALVWLGFACVVGFDGTPLWCAVRLLFSAAAMGASLAAVRRLTGRRRGGVELALAAVAFPIGAAIGFSFLTTSGISVKGLGGVGMIVGALTLLATGAARSLRGVKRLRRLAAVPVGAVIVVLVWYPLATAVYATNVPRPGLGRETPTDRGLAFRDASFTTSDGVALSGWYIPSSNRAAVVMLHGASSTRSSVLSETAVIARHGYGVLLFDARGHGRSAGRAMDFGWYGDRDIEAAVRYLQGQPDVDRERIGAVGFSMGGEEAIGAMAAFPSLRAVVAEGATNRTFDDKQFLPDEYGVRGWVTQQVERVVYGVTDLLTDASPPISLRDAVKVAAPRHVLLIAAGTVEDEGVVARYLQRASPATVELWEVPGAGHIGGLQTQPADWERNVIAFLDAQLR